MKYSVIYTDKARKNLRKMDRSSAAMIYSWITKNLEGTSDPYRMGKSLKGDLKGVWRYRVGDFRIFTVIEGDVLTIFLIEIRNREHAYDDPIDFEEYQEEYQKLKESP